MNQITAGLCKKQSEDQIFQMEDHVPIGKEYVVDLDSRKMQRGYNEIKKVYWEREIIWTNSGWLPTELLEKMDGTPL